MNSESSLTSCHYLVLYFQTLLLDHKEVPPQLIEADLPDDDRSQHSGSFKGGKLSQRHPKEKGKVFSSPGQSPGRAIVLPPGSALAAAASAKY